MRSTAIDAAGRVPQPEDSRATLTEALLSGNMLGSEEDGQPC